VKSSSSSGDWPEMRVSVSLSPYLLPVFWRNAVQWRDRAPGKDVDALIERFQELELSGANEPVMWELRQVAFRKRHG